MVNIVHRVLFIAGIVHRVLFIVSIFLLSTIHGKYCSQSTIDDIVKEVYRMYIDKMSMAQKGERGMNVGKKPQ